MGLEEIISELIEEKRTKPEKASSAIQRKCVASRRLSFSRRA